MAEHAKERKGRRRLLVVGPVVGLLMVGGTALGAFLAGVVGTGTTHVPTGTAPSTVTMTIAQQTPKKEAVNPTHTAKLLTPTTTTSKTTGDIAVWSMTQSSGHSVTLSGLSATMRTTASGTTVQYTTAGTVKTATGCLASWWFVGAAKLYTSPPTSSSSTSTALPYVMASGQTDYAGAQVYLETAGATVSQNGCAGLGKVLLTLTVS